VFCAGLLYTLTQTAEGAGRGIEQSAYLRVARA
jgi:hypothetical protein